jgi:hypothetical protein
VVVGNSKQSVVSNSRVREYRRFEEVVVDKSRNGRDAGKKKQEEQKESASDASGE